MTKPDRFVEGNYAVGIDTANSVDVGIVALIKLGKRGEPDELVASLTWEEAKLIARAVAEQETG